MKDKRKKSQLLISLLWLGFWLCLFFLSLLLSLLNPFAKYGIINIGFIDADAYSTIRYAIPSIIIGIFSICLLRMALLISRIWLKIVVFTIGIIGVLFSMLCLILTFILSTFEFKMS